MKFMTHDYEEGARDLLRALEGTEQSSDNALLVAQALMAVLANDDEKLPTNITVAELLCGLSLATGGTLLQATSLNPAMTLEEQYEGYTHAVKMVIQIGEFAEES